MLKSEFYNSLYKFYILYTGYPFSPSYVDDSSKQTKFLEVDTRSEGIYEHHDFNCQFLVLKRH